MVTKRLYPYHLPKRLGGTPLLFVPLFQPALATIDENRWLIVSYVVYSFVVRVTVLLGWQVKGKPARFSKPRVFEFTPDAPQHYVCESLSSICNSILDTSLIRDGYRISVFRPCLTVETPRVFEEFFASIQRIHGAGKELRLTAESLTVKDWVALGTRTKRIMLSERDWLRLNRPDLSALPEWKIPFAIRV